MPTIEWNIDPVFFEIPRTLIVIVLGLIGLMTIFSALSKKEAGSALGGFALIGLAWVITRVMGESLPIRYYSLLFVGVFLGGYALLNWQIRRGGGGKETAGDFIIYGVLGVLVGSRLGHVLFYDLEKAINDPLWVLQIWTGGLASHGAVIGLTLAMYLFCKRRGVSFLEGADRFAFSAALGATLVRLGNFFNSEILGRVTDGSWGVRFVRFEGPDAPPRHPSQLYEVALGLIVMAALYATDRALGREKRPRGALISAFFLVYFSGRFIVEFFKEYQTLPASSPLTMGQLLSIPGFLLGVVGLVWSLKRQQPAGWPAEDEEDLDEEDEDDEDDYDQDDEDDYDENLSDDEQPDADRSKKAPSKAAETGEPELDERK